MTYLFFMYFGAALLTGLRLFPHAADEFKQETLKMNDKDQYYWKMFDYFGLLVFRSLKLERKWS